RVVHSGRLSARENFWSAFPCVNRCLSRIPSPATETRKDACRLGWRTQADMVGPRRCAEGLGRCSCDWGTQPSQRPLDVLSGASLKLLLEKVCAVNPLTGEKPPQDLRAFSRKYGCGHPGVFLPDLPLILFEARLRLSEDAELHIDQHGHTDLCAGMALARQY